MRRWCHLVCHGGSRAASGSEHGVARSVFPPGLTVLGTDLDGLGGFGASVRVAWALEVWVDTEALSYAGYAQAGQAQDINLPRWPIHQIPSSPPGPAASCLTAFDI
jgi:hypothetical protein